MKRYAKLLAVIMTISLFALMVIGSGSSSSTEAPTEKKAYEENASEEKSDTTEKKADSSKGKEEYEIGQPVARTYTNSIGTVWIQVVVPVTNTGDTNLYMSAGTMDLEDKDGSLLDSKSLVSAYPDVLQPGETGYYYLETTTDFEKPQDVNVVPHVDVEKAKVDAIRYAVSDVKLSDDSFGGVKITGRVENATDEDASLVYVVAFLYDKDNNMIGSEFTIMSDDIKAGDKMGFSMSGISLPDDVTADKVDHYEIYAYPTQFNF